MVKLLMSMGRHGKSAKDLPRIWINPEDAKNDPDMYLANGMYMKVSAVNGQLVAIMAPAVKDAMQETAFRREMLSPLQAYVQGDPSPKSISWMDYEYFGGLTDNTGTIGGVPITTETIEFVP